MPGSDALAYAETLAYPSRQPRPDRDKPAREQTMTGSLEERFQSLHEFVTQARTNLNRNNWDI